MDQRYAAIPGHAGGERHRAGQDTDQTRTARAALACCALVVLSTCALATGNGQTASMDPRRNMTSDDRHIASVTMQIAMERRADNQASTWTNGLSGNHGAVVPRRTYRSRSGDYCRRFDETVTVAGVTANFERTACRGGDGRWTALT